MNFWIIAVALFAVSAAAFCWPLFAGSAKDRITAIFVLLAIPVAGLGLYRVIGTPEAINVPMTGPQQTAQTQAHASEAGEMDALLAQLQQRLVDNPNNPDGWLILGRTLKTQQRFTEALTALENANRLIPNTPMIMVELAEARLFASGTPEITGEIKQLIEAAVAIDPQHQKGLWLLGMAAAEEGDNAKAVSYWQTLLGLLEPGSPSAQRVSDQITQAGGNPAEAVMAPATPVVETAMPATEAEVSAEELLATPTVVAESGIPVSVGLANELAGAVPANATLFVFVHPAGGAGMPLAVKRLAAHGFPMSLNFTDADLLQAGNSLANFDQLDISARISLAGSVVPTAGDIQADRVTVDTKAVRAIALNLNQRIP